MRRYAQAITVLGLLFILSLPQGCAVRTYSNIQPDSLPTAFYFNNEKFVITHWASDRVQIVTAIESSPECDPVVIVITGDFYMNEAAIVIPENKNVTIVSDPSTLYMYTITQFYNCRHFIVHGHLMLINIQLCTGIYQHTHAPIPTNIKPLNI